MILPFTMFCEAISRVSQGHSKLISVLSRRFFSATNGLKSDRRVLTAATMNPHIKQIEYAVRGAIVIRAAEIEKEMAKVGNFRPWDDCL